MFQLAVETRLFARITSAVSSCGHQEYGKHGYAGVSCIHLYVLKCFLLMALTAPGFPGDIVPRVIIIPRSSASLYEQPQRFICGIMG